MDNISEERQPKEIILHGRTYSLPLHAAIIALEAYGKPWYLAVGSLTEPLFARGPTKPITDTEKAISKLILSTLSKQGNVSMNTLIRLMAQRIPKHSTKRRETKYRWLRKILADLEARGLIEVALDPKDSRKKMIIAI